MAATSTTPTRHHLVVIGYTGTRRVYLDVSREEAIRRYSVAENDPNPSPDLIDEFDFTDEFRCYDVWAEEVQP